MTLGSQVSKTEMCDFGQPGGICRASKSSFMVTHQSALTHDANFCFKAISLLSVNTMRDKGK